MKTITLLSDKTQPREINDSNVPYFFWEREHKVPSRIVLKLSDKCFAFIRQRLLKRDFRAIYFNVCPYRQVDETADVVPESGMDLLSFVTSSRHIGVSTRARDSRRVTTVVLGLRDGQPIIKVFLAGTNSPDPSLRTAWNYSVTYPASVLGPVVNYSNYSIKYSLEFNVNSSSD